MTDICNGESGNAMETMTGDFEALVYKTYGEMNTFSIKEMTKSKVYTLRP